MSFGTNWVAEAEHGGFFQAVADGTYKSYGLDVTIVPGGPNVDNRALLIAGKLDFFMTANNLKSFEAVADNVPVVSIAAMFQKDPQVLLAHPTSKVTKLEDFRSLTLFVSKEGLSSYFQWLKSEYRFSEGKVKPYTNNLQPFLFDKRSAMQGYVSSEPFLVEKQGAYQADRHAAGRLRVRCLLHLDRDPARTRRQQARSGAAVRRCLDHRLVQLSLRRQQARQRLIKKLNPDMTDELLAYSVAKMKEYGIVDSGDALRDGIGAMTDARFANFFDKMSRAGVVRRDLDFRKAYTLQFINKGVGLDLAAKKMARK